jgi:hypothetical protein
VSNEKLLEMIAVLTAKVDRLIDEKNRKPLSSFRA